MSKSHARKLTLVATGVILSTVMAWADTSTTGTASSDPGVSGPQISQLPPMFDSSVAATMGQQMLNCFNVGAALSDVAGAFKKKRKKETSNSDDIATIISNTSANLNGPNLGTGGSCGRDDVPSDFVCPNLGSADAVEKLLEKKKGEIEDAKDAISCEKSKFTAVQTQLSCLQNQSQVLAAQVRTLQKAFQDNIQRMQTDVAQIKSVETDRNTQLEDVTAKLGGDKANGTMGLLAMKDAVEKAINTEMPQQILTIKESFNQVELARKSLDENIQSRVMGQSSDCFNTNAGAGFRCAPNGPPVSIREYVLCRYEQNQQLGDGGVIERNSIVKNQAQANRAGLEAVLNSILGDSARMTPSDPRSAPSANNPIMNYAGTISNPADIEAQYGSKLSSFNGKGLDIHNFVMAQVKGCYSKANKIVQREKLMKGSAIGQQTEALNAQVRKTQAEVGTFVDRYGQLFTQSMAALTGQHLPLNTSACRSGSPAVQQSCLDDLKTNMTGLLMGNTQNSTMNVQIKGTNPATYIPLSCQGLQGCVTALQNTSSNLQKEVKRLDQFKKDYVLKANQNVQAFTKQMATMLSPQSTALNQKLGQLSQVLASLGVNPLQIKGIQGEKPEPDADGLPGVPNNVLALVGSQMSPPMPDFEGDSFSDGLRSIAEGRSKLDEKSSAVAQAEGSLEAQAQSCMNSVRERAGDILSKVLGSFKDCVQVKEQCERYSKDGKLDDLARTLNQLELSDGGVDPSILSSGLNDCRENLPKLESEESCGRKYPEPQQRIYLKDDGKLNEPLFEEKHRAWQKDLDKCRRAAQTGEGVFSGKSAAGCPDAQAISRALIKFGRSVGGTQGIDELGSGIGK